MQVNRLKLGRMLTIGSVFEGIEMELNIDAIIIAVLFEDKDTGLVK